MRRIGVVLGVFLMVQGLLMPMADRVVRAQDDSTDPEQDLFPAYEVEQELQRAFSGISRAWDEWFYDMDLDVPQKPMLVLIRPGEVATIEGCIDPATQKAIVISSHDSGIEGQVSTPVFCVIDGTVSNISISPDWGEPDYTFGPRVTGVIAMPIEALAVLSYGPPGSAEYPVAWLAPTMLLAHEYAHFVQFELSSQLRRTLPIESNREGLSDCLAGDIFATIGRDILAERQDAAINLIDTIERIGVEIPEAGHGTGTERREAFSYGFVLGSLDRDSTEFGGKIGCLLRYWPETLA